MVSKKTYQQRVMAEKRQAAVKAAMELFLEQGYERTSLQQIADRAGVSTATLFKRFATKAELFQAIVPEFWSLELQSETPLNVGDPSSGLRKMGRDLVALCRNPALLAFYRVFIAESQHFPEMGMSILSDGKWPYVQGMAAYLRKEMDAGYLVAGDAYRAASQFFGIITDQVFWPVLLAPGYDFTSEEAEIVIEEAMLTIMARYSG